VNRAVYGERHRLSAVLLINYPSYRLDMAGARWTWAGKNAISSDAFLFAILEWITRPHVSYAGACACSCVKLGVVINRLADDAPDDVAIAQ